MSSKSAAENNMRHLYTIAALFFFTITYTSSTAAQWTLNNAESQLSFVTVKAGNIGEVHRFKMLSGVVSTQGEVSIDIHLASVDTLIPIRDERMQKLLFEANVFPTAKFSANIGAEVLNDLTTGSALQTTVTGQLTLKEVTLDLTMQVMAARLNNSTLLITSVQPILIDAGAVGLGEGVEQLRILAGLTSISNAVPVTFVLTFNTRG